MTSSFIYQLTNYPIRTLKTTFICVIFVGLGLSVAGVGPALLDLQLLAGTTLEKAALILPARSLGYAFGSVVGGIAGDRLDHQKVIIASMIVAITTLCLFALFKSIVVMGIIIFIGGIALGVIDTVANVWVIFIWGKYNPPFMQIVHSAYGLGAFIAPFMVEPFLLNKETDISTNASSNSTVLKGLADDVMVHWPFQIAALFYFVVLLGFLLVYFLFPENTIHPSRTECDPNEDSQAKKDKFKLNKPVSKYTRIFIVVLSIIAMHAYCGLEISFGSLLSPFAVKSNLQMTKSEASFLTSSYWGCFTFLRVFSLIAIIYLSPRLLLMLNFIIIMLSNAILMPFGNDYRWALWLGTNLMGLGCSSVFATVFAFLEQLIPVTARITAGFLIAACIGELVIPALVAAYLDTTPQVFLWVVMSYSTVSFLGVLILMFLQHLLLKHQRKEEIEMQKIEDDQVAKY